MYSKTMLNHLVWGVPNYIGSGLWWFWCLKWDTGGWGAVDGGRRKEKKRGGRKERGRLRRPLKGHWSTEGGWRIEIGATCDYFLFNFIELAKIKKKEIGASCPLIWRACSYSHSRASLALRQPVPSSPPSPSPSLPPRLSLISSLRSFLSHALSVVSIWTIHRKAWQHKIVPPANWFGP